MKIFRYLFIILFVAALAFVGTCTYQAIKGTDESVGPEPPPVDKAGYTVIIKATGQVFYTGKVTDSQGVVTMYGYWEVRKDKYKFKDITLPLDEKIFGEIEVRGR